MSTSYTDKGLPKIADGDDNYGADGRKLIDLLDTLIVPQKVLYVSPLWTDLAVNSAEATDRRHFATIQDAIDAWEARGFGDGANGMILVYPGDYEECLSPTKSAALVASHSAGFEALGAGRGVRLVGDGSTNPLIDFQPGAGETHTLTFSGFTFADRAEAVAGEQPVTVLRTYDQGAGNYGAYHSVVCFERCLGRLDGGGNNGWTRAIDVRANVTAVLRDCKFSFPSNYAGGIYCRYPFYVSGNETTGKLARLIFEGGRYLHYEFSGATNRTIVTNAASYGHADGVKFNRTHANTLASFGAAFEGLNSASEAEEFGNRTGVNTVHW
jgi:hypothetical protein